MRRRDLVLILTGAMASARAAPAEQQPMPVIGYLSSTSREVFASYVGGVAQGLGDTGWVEGRNVTIEYRWAEGHYDRLPALAADLVGRRVDVLLVGGGGTGVAVAKRATATIPIVFFAGYDPVAAGLVASLSHPGGNLTGISILARELNAKRLQLLCEVVPQAERIAALVNPTAPGPDDIMRDMQQAARANGRQLFNLTASTEAEIDAAFPTLIQLHVGALVVTADSFFNTRRGQLTALAARHGIPAVYEWREFADAGGLISYGSNLVAGWRQAGVYVGEILLGAKPADMPILQPTRFELVINLKTAQALGLTIPPSILGRADEVIE